MTLHLIYGPTGSGKTARAVEEFMGALDAGKNPVFLAPTRPDALHFQRRILTSRPVISGGEVTTFNSLFSRLLSQVGEKRPVISSEERQQLLREAISRQKSPDVLARSCVFAGFVLELADLISELESLDVEPARLATVMKRWAGNDPWKQGLNRDLFQIYQEYRHLLTELQSLDPDEAARLALDGLREKNLSAGTSCFVIDGFWDFTVAEKSLIEALMLSGAEIHLTLPYQENHPAFDTITDLWEELRRGADVEVLKPASGTDDRWQPSLAHISQHLYQTGAPRVAAQGSVITMKAAGTRGQAELVAAEVLKLWRDGVSLDDIAIITRGRGSDITNIALTLGDFHIPFETAVPVPLAATAVGRTALAALELTGTGRSADVFSYLRSPLPVADASAVDSFDRAVRGKGIRDFDSLMCEWENLTGAPIIGIERLKKAAEAGTPDLAQELIQLMRELFSMSVKGGPDPDLTGEDARAFKQLASICGAAADLEARLSDLDRDQGKSAPSLACRKLAQAIEAAAVRPRTGVKRGCVRLLDPHRALNQNFDIVFICGLLEGQFPFLGGENSLLPDADRFLLRGYDGSLLLKTGEQRLAQERFLFYRTLTRARRKIYLCYPYCDEEGKPTVRSLFVDDVLDLLEERSWDREQKRIGDITFASDEAPVPKQALLSLSLSAAGQAGAARPRAEALQEAAAPANLHKRLEGCLAAADPRLPEIGERVKELLRDREYFKVTELEQYLKCPFGYFLDRVIRAEPLESETFARDRGSLAHEILAEFFSQLSPGGIFLANADSSQLAEARRIMEKVVRKKFGETGDDLQALIMKTHLLGHLDRFVERERTCRPGFRLYRSEWSFGICDGPPGGRFDEETMLNFGEVKVCGRMDRVDLRQGKSQAIVIDYKTSADSRLPSQAKFEASGTLQVPIYMLALRDIWGLEPVGGEYYGILGKKRRGLYLKQYGDILGAASGELVITDLVDEEVFEDRLEKAREMAISAARGIRAGNFDLNPLSPEVCEYCGRDELCRFSESGRLRREGE